jgi:hypothetical protein
VYVALYIINIHQEEEGTSIDLWGTPPEEEHREDEVPFNTTF